MTYYSAITGLGIYTPIGKNIPEFQAALSAGTDGIGEIKRFPTDEFSAKYAGMIDPQNWEELGHLYPDLDQRITMALISAQEAIKETNLEKYSPERVGLILGICLGKLAGDDGYKSTDGNWKETSPLWVAKLQFQAHQLAQHLKIRGPAIAISTACASSNHAVGYGQDLLRFGYLDAVIVSGTSEVTPHMFAGFYGLKNMSDAPCAPYSIPIGLNLGEGAGCMILEKRRTDDPKPKWGSLSGYGAGSDAYHPTTPDPKGMGVARAINSALSDLNAKQDEIGYINSHGTGTHENDLSEWLGIKLAFGQQSARIPISSSKSFMGHTGGAAGIIESIITLIGLKNEFLPALLHFTRARRIVPDKLVTSGTPIRADYQSAVNCNSGFGGANAATIFSKAVAGTWKPLEVSGISVLGVGSISNYGLNALDRVFLGTAPKLSDTTPNMDGFEVPNQAAFITEDDLRACTGKRDERFLDPLTNYMITASSLALADAQEIESMPGAEQTGIITGVSHIPSKSLLEFRNSIKDRGVLGTAAHAFSKVVMNASMGGVCETLMIKGPSNTIAASEGAGIFSIAQACMTLIRDKNTEAIYAVAGDELGDIPLAMHSLLDRKYLPSEGAGSVLLSRESRVPADIQVAGIGLSGPDNLKQAIEQACGHHSVTDIPLVMLTDDGDPITRENQALLLREVWGTSFESLITFNPASIMGYADACTSMFAFILSVQILREGRFMTHTMNAPVDMSTILVLHSSHLNGSCAVLLQLKQQ